MQTLLQSVPLLRTDRRISPAEKQVIVARGRASVDQAYSFIDYTHEAIRDTDAATVARITRMSERLAVETMQLDTLVRRLERLQEDSKNAPRFATRITLLRDRIGSLIQMVEDEQHMALESA